MASINMTVVCQNIEREPEYNRDNGDMVLLDEKQQLRVLQMKQLQCACRMWSEPQTLTGAYCNRTWDNVMCWDDTPAGTTAVQPCPAYINIVQVSQYAYRVCNPNGTWYNTNNGSERGWTNYSMCFAGSVTAPTTPAMDVPYLLTKHVHELRIMYNVGYGVSLTALLLAFTIMIYFRKLHCSRNIIHLNLFASFICRAAISLIRDNFMVMNTGFPKDFSYDSGGKPVFTSGPHWECKLFWAIFQYFIIASNIWIFMEALYLNMLIYVSIFTEKVKVVWYIAIGWSVPILFVLAWCISRILLDNTMCWNINRNTPGLAWIIYGPIILSVVINFFFFISLVRVLYTKLSASPCPEVKRNKYRRLARSTMLLIPIFGVYYIIFTVFTILNSELTETLEFAMLFTEMIFNSYQGFLIALIFCFINTEVRTEIKRAWRQRKMRRGSHCTSYQKSKKPHIKMKSSLEQSNNMANCGPSPPDLARAQLPANRRETIQISLMGNSEECPFITEISEIMTESNGSAIEMHVAPVDMSTDTLDDTNRNKTNSEKEIHSDDSTAEKSGHALHLYEYENRPEFLIANDNHESATLIQASQLKS